MTGEMDRRKEALEELRDIQKELLKFLEKNFQQYSDSELELLEETLIQAEIGFNGGLVWRSDGRPLSSELASSYQYIETDVLTCSLEDVPLFIKGLTKYSNRGDRLKYGAAVWRLKIGK